MQKLPLLPQSISSKTPPPMATECWLDDAYIIEMDHFIKTLSNINTNDVKPDLIGSIIIHYASKWLPDLAGEDSTIRFEGSPKSATASWMKKRFFIDSIVGILPQDKDCVPCNFLLRLLRAANMVGVDPAHSVELEKRVSWNLDQASLKELMIPSFNHNCSTLLDVELVSRLVMRFVNLEEVARNGGGSLAKVAKLVDGYLAEAAVDSHLKLSDFVELASALPSHARSMDDRLYRAIDTYLKAHPGLSKPERKTLCNLIDSRKLSPEASFHAAQNERLPVRAVIQVLLSEQTKLYNHIEWSGSLSGTGTRSTGLGLEGPGRCHSKREMNVQHLEIQRLKEDVLRLQCQCMNMERQIEKLTEKKSKSYNFSWKKLGIPVFKTNKIGKVEGEGEANGAVKTPLQMKARLVKSRTSTKWRKSSS